MKFIFNKAGATCFLNSPVSIIESVGVALVTNVLMCLVMYVSSHVCVMFVSSHVCAVSCHVCVKTCLCHVMFVSSHAYVMFVSNYVCISSDVCDFQHQRLMPYILRCDLERVKSVIATLEEDLSESLFDLFDGLCPVRKKAQITYECPIDCAPCD